MRAAVFTLAALLGLAGSVGAQTPWANKLFSGNVNHDFGTVARGAQLKHTFKMINIYKVPLQITDIRIECGCVTVFPATKLIQPNDTADILFNMDASRFNGAKNVKVHITVGPDFISTATLSVSANARQDVVFNPGEIDFGQIGKGQAATKYIDVEHAGDQGWRINEIVKNSAAPFDLKVEQLPQKVSGYVTVGYRIFATLKPGAVSGNFKQEVLLKTNDPQSSVITFNVLGNVRTSLSVAPNPVTLPALKVGGQESTKIVVSGSRPFRIVAIEGLEDGLTIPLPDRSATNHILELKVQPRTAGDLKKQITLRTDLDGESATITVEGSIAP